MFLLVPDWTAFCPGCSKQSWLNTFHLAAFGVPPMCEAGCRPDMASACLVIKRHHVMSFPNPEFPKHCCHLWQARCFYLFIHGLFIQQISLRTSGYYRHWAEHKKQTRTYRSVVFWWRLSGPPHLIFLLRKLRPRKIKCSTTSGLSASYCPSWREGLLLKCGGTGPKFHVCLWHRERDGLTPLWE